MSALGIGVQLTIFGMGLVFLLLAIMAALIKLLLKSDSMEPQSAVIEEAEEISAHKAEGFDADALAAITIAVTRHCTVCRKEAAPVMRQHQPGTLPSRWVSGGRTLQNVSWQPGRRK
ncbi:MAG: OadG family protein [Syntrophobacteraceae bacterium]